MKHLIEQDGIVGLVEYVGGEAPLAQGTKVGDGFHPDMLPHVEVIRGEVKHRKRRPLKLSAVRVRANLSDAVALEVLPAGTRFLVTVEYADPAHPSGPVASGESDGSQIKFRVVLPGRYTVEADGRRAVFDAD